MTDRATLKIDPDVRDQLREHKRDGETWSGVLKRAADALRRDAQREQFPGAPRCSSCGTIAHVWTVEDGDLLCPSCAERGVDAAVLD